MIDHSVATLDIVSVHQVGNKNNGEDILLSKHPLDANGQETEALLKKYFLNAFSTPEYFHFSFSNGDHTLNPLYKFASASYEPTSRIGSSLIFKDLRSISNPAAFKASDNWMVLMDP